MQQKKTLSQQALVAAEGVFAYSVDLMLWLLIYTAELSIPRPRNGQLWKAKVGADRFLRQVNYEVVKNALLTAHKNKWVQTKHRGAWPEITEAGRMRLEQALPSYDARRLWDGRIHLVTYDIAESDRAKRERLRWFLKRLGCGKLQDSVWLTPYNPIDTLRAFIAEHNLAGTVIVSDLGVDGSIGEEDVRAMLARVYELEALNKKYELWLSQEKQSGLDASLLLSYYAILRSDPQLPFALLPPWWVGDAVYNIVNSSRYRYAG